MQHLAWFYMILIIVKEWVNYESYPAMLHIINSDEYEIIFREIIDSNSIDDNRLSFRILFF